MSLGLGCALHKPQLKCSLCRLQIALSRNFDSSKITPLICGTPSTAVAGNQCDIDG